MIHSFRDRRTERLFHRQKVKGLSLEIQKAAHRKLLLLHAANSLNDLRIPPGNRLEKLAGNRQGQYSIRVNDQWRICFDWNSGHPGEVEFVDYHC